MRFARAASPSAHTECPASCGRLLASGFALATAALLEATAPLRGLVGACWKRAAPGRGARLAEEDDVTTAHCRALSPGAARLAMPPPLPPRSR